MHRAAFAVKFAITISVLFFGVAYSYFHLFSIFQPYDDEGYVIYSIRNFLSGAALYDECTTQYGPAFFLIHSLVFEALWVPLTHDGMRIVSLAWWILGSAVVGLVVARVASSIQAGWACFFSSLVVASAIASEPGHPQAMLYALTALGALAAVSDRKPLTVAVLGVIAGVITATKINIAIFFGAAIVWTFLSLGRNNKTASLFWWCCAVGILAMPAVLMAEMIHTARIRDYAIVATVATINLVVVSRSSAIAAESSRPAAQVIVIAIAIFLACCGYSITTGTSIAGLMHGLVWQHLGFAGEFFEWPPTVGPREMAAITLSLPSLALYLYAVSRPTWTARAHWIVAVGQIALGAVVFFGLLYQWKRFAFVLPWMWLAAIDIAPASKSDSSIRRRLPLLALSCFLFLQAYPIAGSQWSFAMGPLIPLSWVCIADGLRAIPALAKSTVIAPRLCGAARTAILIGAAVAFLGMTRESKRRYDQGDRPVFLKGTSLLQIREYRLAILETVALNVRHNANKLFTIPGMYSFCLWSGVESPTLRNQGNWPIFMSEIEQEALAEEIQDARGMIVVRNDWLLQFWNRPGLKSFGPAVEYVEREFQSTGSVGGYEIAVRPASRSEFRFAGARWMNRDSSLPQRVESEYALVHAPPVGGTIRAARIGSEKYRLLFDAKKTEGGPFIILDESGDFSARRRKIELNEWRTFVIPFTSEERSTLGESQFVQLLDGSGEVVLRLCFVEPTGRRPDLRAAD